ncbi:MAG: oligopeptide:H+ symporter, partial [Acidobacteriota bacterium]
MATAENASSKYDKSFFGHPGGLSTLFFTEMWERFSYYGMRALLVLYMVAAVKDGGLGFETADATAIYGLYTASVYFLPLIGGWLADRFIGAKRSTLIGGVIIALGHFTLAVPSLTFFYLGLVLVAVGTGFLKSNISAMVGDLYDEDDERRDGGFSIFYMGINLGAFAAPLITGALAAYNWHWGFAAAGVGMVAGLIQYVIGKQKLAGVGEPPVKTELDGNTSMTTNYIIQVAATIAVGFGILLYFYSTRGIDFTLKITLIPVLVVGGLIVVLFTGMLDKLSLNDWKRLGIIVILFLFASLFWAGFEQAGSSFNLFAEKLTDRTIGTWEMPTAWFQSINSIFIVIMAPIFG